MSQKISSTFEKKDNGNIEIVYTIPASILKAEYSKVISELSGEVTLPGFRKGKAPLNKVVEAISDEKITEHILSHILPEAFTESVKENKFNPAMYPKFESVKIASAKNLTDDGEWQIKATTCELPKVVLGDYKKKLKGKNKEEIAKELPAILKLDIPRLLIEEEVNARLSQLLDRIEKLGLQLESYLKSVGKDVEGLRKEYEDEAYSAISLEIILNQVANEEKVEVDDKMVDEFIKITGSDSTKVNEDQKVMIRRILARREALEKITPKS